MAGNCGRKSSGAIEFDMGQTEEDNPGFLAFKNHWFRSRRGWSIYAFRKHNLSIP